MKYISSRDNPIYKSALKLTRKKYRDETGMFLLEGIKPLKDALTAGMDIKSVFVSDSVSEHPATVGILAELPESCSACCLEGKLFSGLSDTEASQGIIAAVVKSTADIGEGGIAVLDRLQDPGNTGTIIRTAEAAGYGGIAVIRGTVDIYSPKVVRAAAGSLIRMPVLFFNNATEAAEFLHRTGRKLVVTCPDGAVDYREADLGADMALIVGNEGGGVSDEFMALADIKVKIPMKGQIESLNVAVAAGILMFHGNK